jgi:hypothetical protein
MSAVKKGVTALALAAAGLAVALVAAPWTPAPRAESLFVKPMSLVQEKAAQNVWRKRGVRPVQAQVSATGAPANTGSGSGDAGRPAPCPDCSPAMAGRAGP